MITLNWWYKQKKNNTKLVTGVSTSNKVLGLIPTVVRKDNILDLSGAVQLYEDYLPSPKLCTLELRRWKQYWQACLLDSCPSTCAATIKTVDKLTYPNILVILQIPARYRWLLASANAVPVLCVDCTLGHVHPCAKKDLQHWHRYMSITMKVLILMMLLTDLQVSIHEKWN